MSKRDGQDASSTVELALLLPVYMLLFVAVLTIGHLVLVRQQVVLAVRYQAWLANDGTGQRTNMNVNFFPSFTGYGTYTKTGTSTSEIDFARDPSLQNAFPIPAGAPQNALRLAQDVLNDTAGPHRHLLESTVSGKFHYQPAWLGPFFNNLRFIEPNTTCTVFLRQDVAAHAERKILHVGAQPNDPLAIGDHNPIEEYLYPNRNNPAPPYFLISTEPNGTNNRFYTPGAPDSTQLEQGMSLQTSVGGQGIQADPQGGGNTGIWDTNFRFGGDASNERAFFHLMIYGF